MTCCAAVAASCFRSQVMGRSRSCTTTRSDSASSLRTMAASAATLATTLASSRGLSTSKSRRMISRSALGRPSGSRQATTASSTSSAGWPIISAHARHFS